MVAQPMRAAASVNASTHNGAAVTFLTFISNSLELARPAGGSRDSTPPRRWSRTPTPSRLLRSALRSAAVTLQLRLAGLLGVCFRHTLVVRLLFGDAILHRCLAGHVRRLLLMRRGRGRGVRAAGVVGRRGLRRTARCRIALMRA